MSKFKKIEAELQELGFVHERNSGNAHAIFRHGRVTEFKLTVPCTPKSWGAENKPLKKARLFAELLESGMEYVEAVNTNILFRHKNDPEKVLTIPSRPRGMAALKEAVAFAQSVNDNLASEVDQTAHFNSKSERKAWRKAQWKPGFKAPN